VQYANENALNPFFATVLFLSVAIAIQKICPATYSAVSLLAPLYLIIHSAVNFELPSLMVAGCIMPVAMMLIGGPMSICLHRYFAHRAFETSRFVRFILGVCSCFAFQGGPLWWGRMHLRHHKFCDRKEDPHSISHAGFWYAFLGWSMNPQNYIELSAEASHGIVQKHSYEIELVEQFFFVPPIVACVLYATFAGYTNMIFLLLLPMTICRLVTALFNVEYHPAKEDSQECQSIDNSRLLAQLVGESKHKHHHTHPRRMHRPDWDFPYWLVLYPLKSAGVIWNCF